MNCGIIRDLLPLYHDGVCSAESRTAVEEHLAVCGQCRAALAEMDTPLPEAKKAAADDAAVVEKLSEGWKRSKQRAWLKGAVLAAAVCAALFGGWYALANFNWIPVDTGDIQITELSRLQDGRIAFHMFVDDRKDLREVRYQYDDDGTMYIRPLRPVLIGDRSMVGGLWDWDYEFDVEAYNETAAGRNEAEITRIYLGRGKDAVLLWEEGMELPAASPAMEKAVGGEN